MDKLFIGKKEKIQEITLENFKEISHNNSNIDSFYLGIYCLYKDKLTDSKNHFRDALNGTDETELNYFEFLSFLGISEVLLSNSSGGLNRCYEAANGFSTDPVLYFNIAYAEYSLENRRRAVIAIENYLKHDTTHTYTEFFTRCMKKRCEKNEKRTNVAKNIIGKFFRKKGNCTEECFSIIFKDHLSNKLQTHMREATKNKTASLLQ